MSHKRNLFRTFASFSRLKQYQVLQHNWWDMSTRIEINRKIKLEKRIIMFNIRYFQRRRSVTWNDFSKWCHFIDCRSDVWNPSLITSYNVIQKLIPILMIAAKKKSIRLFLCSSYNFRLIHPAQFFL